MRHLEITEVALVHCNIAKMMIRKIQYTLIHYLKYPFITNKSFGQLLDISPKHFIFLKTLTQNFHALKCGLLIKILNL